MTDHSPSFAYLLETDLARKGLSQRELAAKMTEQGEPPLTEQAISSWKARGKVPGRRMVRLLEILGPDSEVGKAQSQRSVSYRFGGLTDNTESSGYPKRDEYKPVRERQTTFRSQAAVRPPDSVVEQHIRDALPEALRSNFDKAVKVGPLSLRVDYLSDKAAVEIRTGLRSDRIQQSLYQLALIASVCEPRVPPRHLGLLMLRTPGEAEIRLERTKLEASLLGLQLVVVDSPEEAAQQIEEWEKHPPEDLFSS